jgi:hypothetical protein
VSSKKTAEKRRTGLGVNPLDALLDVDGPEPEPGRAEAEEPVEDHPRKVRATYHLPEEVVEGLRDTAMHLAGPPEYLTLSGLVEGALRKELERLQKKHNQGQPFPRRPHDLRGGRPVGS